MQAVLKNIFDFCELQSNSSAGNEATKGAFWREKRKSIVKMYAIRVVNYKNNCYNEIMLTDAFPKLKDTKAVALIRAFIRSPWYLVLVVTLMACAELFSLELPVFYFYFVLIVVAVLFDEDLLGVFVLVPCHYLAISAPNNPGKHAVTLFSTPERMVHLVILISVYAVLLSARLLSLLLKGGKRQPPELTFGIVFFAIALILGGAFSGYWGKRTIVFGLVEALSLFAIYFFFYYAVNWKELPKHYGMMLFVALGVGVLAEVVGMYFNSGAVIGTFINRAAFYTGWGIHNNVGCVMAMCMPAPFYLAIKKKEGWAFAIVGTLFYLGVMLSQSRGAMLFGTLIFLVCIVLMLVLSKGFERIKSAIVFGAFALVVLVTGLVLRERVLVLFRAIREAGFDDSLRFDTYRACWARFLEAPWFGSGFYHTPGTVLQNNGMWTTMEGAGETGFLPPRAHNTLFQLLASGGVFMVLAYLVHRIQTLILFFRHPSAEKTFVFLCVLALLLTSLLDCHLFNFGPGLLYASLLAIAQGNNLKNEKRSIPTLKELLKKRKRKEGAQK